MNLLQARLGKKLIYFERILQLQPQPFYQERLLYPIFNPKSIECPNILCFYWSLDWIKRRSVNHLVKIICRSENKPNWNEWFRLAHSIDSIFPFVSIQTWSNLPFCVFYTKGTCLIALLKF